jgi:hypothetical protein
MTIRPVELLAQIHDELLFECDEDLMMEACQMIRKVGRGSKSVWSPRSHDSCHLEYVPFLLQNRRLPNPDIASLIVFHF